MSSQLEKQNGFCRYIVTNNKVTLWSASYSAYVVYTKTTIIHLSVVESDGYLPSRYLSTTIHLHFGSNNSQLYRIFVRLALQTKLITVWTGSKLLKVIKMVMK